MPSKELVEKLEKAGMTFGVALSKAKRKYNDSKLIRTYTNKIENYEQALFKDDEYIVERVLEIERLGNEIVEHIDQVLDLARKREPVESLQEKVQKEVAAKTIQGGNGNG